MPVLPLPSFRPTGEEFKEVRGGHLLGSAKSKVGHRCLARGAKEWFLGLPVQEQLHSNTEEAKGLLLVQRATRPTLPRRARA